MAEQDFFDHINPITGSNPGTRADEEGYYYTRIAENIGAGFTTPESIMAAWLNSPKHRDTILDPNVTEFGLGYYYLADDTGNIQDQRYWTQVFGAGGEWEAYIPEEEDIAIDPGDGGPTIDDVLEGTSAGEILGGGVNPDLIRGLGGDDVLKGFAGNDTLDGGVGLDTLVGGNNDDRLIGHADNDTLKGGSGNDDLIGVNPDASQSMVGRNEQDVLIGNAGADNYVLGGDGTVYYDDGNDSSIGKKDYALIRGFKFSEGDRIVLAGKASDYVLGTSVNNVPKGTQISLKNSQGADELIGIIQNVNVTNTNDSLFRYV
ncbi:MAG: type I secretion protein [Acaryochloridaceae cyanobacterium RL_2_7]|nr:type I secretion protein [Acaryochloridaceae cyanobacterium RL_2_7]